MYMHVCICRRHSCMQACNRVMFQNVRRKLIAWTTNIATWCPRRMLLNADKTVIIWFALQSNLKKIADQELVLSVKSKDSSSSFCCQLSVTSATVFWTVSEAARGEDRLSLFSSDRASAAITAAYWSINHNAFHTVTFQGSFWLLQLRTRRPTYRPVTTRGTLGPWQLWNVSTPLRWFFVVICKMFTTSTAASNSVSAWTLVTLCFAPTKLNCFTRLFKRIKLWGNSRFLVSCCIMPVDASHFTSC
jgi:hypothetical protein